MINKDIEKYERNKLKNENKTPDENKKIADKVISSIFKNEEIKGFKKYLIYDTEKISGWKYLIRAILFQVLFFLPIIYDQMNVLLTYLLFLIYSYLQSINAFKRSSTLIGSKFHNKSKNDVFPITFPNPMIWGCWGALIIWIQLLNLSNTLNGLLITIPHFILVFSNRSK